MKSIGLKLLLIAVLLKGLIWIFLTPIFQIPDEASHFSIVQYIGETRSMPNNKNTGISPLETLKIAEIVNFDWNIIHPVWRGYQSQWKQKINLIPIDAKKNLIFNPQLTALKRPPLYYWLASSVYFIVKNTSFLTRFITLRLLSLVLSLLTVYFTYKSAKIILKQHLLALATAALVGFQPMFSYIASGVHYDSLAILVVSAFTYFAFMNIKTSKKRYFKICIFLAAIGLMIKPDMIVLVFILPFFLNRRQLKTYGFLSLFSFVILVLMANNRFFVFKDRDSIVTRLVYLINLNEYSLYARFFLNSITTGKIFFQFFDYLKATWKGNIAQIFPWFWGVFGWLEKTMPLIVYRILKLGILISIFGWLKIFITRAWFKFNKIQKRIIYFIVTLVIIHFGIVILNEFIIYSKRQRIFGIQGRYLLLTISSQVILLIFGLMQLVPQKYFNVLAKSIMILSLILNLIGLATIYSFFGWVWS